MTGVLIKREKSGQGHTGDKAKNDNRGGNQNDAAASHGMPGAASIVGKRGRGTGFPSRLLRGNMHPPHTHTP